MNMFKKIPTLLHSERPKWYSILAFLGAIGLRIVQDNRYVSEMFMVVNIMPLNIMFRILDY